MTDTMTVICEFQPVEGFSDIWVCPVCKESRQCSSPPKNRKCGAGHTRPPAAQTETTDPIRSPAISRVTETEYLQTVPPCKYRGEIIARDQECKLCGLKTELYDVYECQVYGRCSLGNRRRAGDPPLRACITCPTLTPPAADAVQVKPAAPSVAVVICCHNYGRFLAEAIQSVLDQTVKPVDIVVVDDASDDDTPTVAMRFSGQVRYIRVDARDVNVTRKTGFDATKSEFIMFLDADDRLPPTYLEMGLPHFLEPRTAIVYGDMQQFGDRTERIYMPDWGTRSIHWENFIHAASILRRSAVLATDAFANLPDQTACNHHNDWALMRHILAGPYVAARQQVPLLYRQHGNNWLTKSRHAGITYYDRVALSIEPLTIYVPLSGRDPGPVFKWLQNQERDKSLCRLVLLDASQSGQFSRDVQAWLQDWGTASRYGDTYRDTRVLRQAIAAPGLADQDARDLTVRSQICQAMHRVYLPLWNLETEYIFTLEDDVLPPLDAIDQLLRQFDRNVFSVASPYRSRYAGWIAWDNVTSGELLTAPRQGIQQTGGNGFGATVLRRSVLQQWAMGPYRGHAEYDLSLYHWLWEQRGWKALINWNCRSHHAGIPPE